MLSYGKIGIVAILVLIIIGLIVYNIAPAPAPAVAPSVPRAQSASASASTSASAPTSAPASAPASTSAPPPPPPQSVIEPATFVNNIVGQAQCRPGNFRYNTPLGKTLVGGVQTDYYGCYKCQDGYTADPDTRSCKK